MWTKGISNLSGDGGGGAVDSVFGRAGDVVASKGDYEQYYLDDAENIIIYKTLLDFQQNTTVVDGKYQLTAGKRYLYGGTGSVVFDLPINLNGSLLDLGSPLFGLAAPSFIFACVSPRHSLPCCLPPLLVLRLQISIGFPLLCTAPAPATPPLRCLCLDRRKLHRPCT